MEAHRPGQGRALTAAARAAGARRGGPELSMWASCAPGTEPETAAELAALGWQPPDRPGLGTPACATAGLSLPWERATVYGCADLAAVLRTLWVARTVTGVALLVHAADLEGGAEELAQTRAAVRGADLARLPDAPFAVRAERRGAHEFRSPELAGVAGAAVIDAVRSRTGRRLPVDLDDPVTEVLVQLDGRRLRVGLDLAGRSLARRDWLVAPHHAGLRPTVAAALLSYVGWIDGETLLDPMAGGATIPIEAGLVARRVPPRSGPLPRLEPLGLGDAALSGQVAADVTGAAARVGGHRTPSLPLHALEKYPKHVAAARANQAAAGLGAAFRIDLGDATVMDDVGGFDRLVTNPPYGMRAGSPRIVAPLYRQLLARTAERLSPSGQAAILTPAAAPLRDAAAAAGLGVCEERSVTLGRLEVLAFRLQPA